KARHHYCLVGKEEHLMPAYRRIFPSYDWDDAWLVNQITQQPNVIPKEELGLISGVPNEEIKSSDEKIKAWINESMNGCSCLILFVGEKTHLSKWCLYEIELAKEKRMGRFIIYLDGMKRKEGTICKKGQDPYEYHGLYGPPDSTRTGYTIEKYSWLSDDGQSNIKEWIEDACKRAGK
ncbi:MAG: TIR domain-containing protein, partial [Spirochaetia bacterium]